jgi:hypothetical protein
MLPNLRKRSTYQTSSSTISFMKDDLNDEVSNKTPKTLISSNGVLTWDELSKLDGRLGRDHATHF